MAIFPRRQNHLEHTKQYMYTREWRNTSEGDRLSYPNSLNSFSFIWEKPQIAIFSEPYIEQNEYELRLVEAW